MSVTEPSEDALQLLRTDDDVQAANWFYSSHTSRWPRSLTPWRIATLALLLSAGLAVLAISSPLLNRRNILQIVSPASDGGPLEPHFLKLDLLPNPPPVLPDLGPPEKSFCVGHVLAASSWTANLGLK
ncbi:unnamed protein product, partial [Polarella glacialis]